jgi:hypothetical protein
MPPRPRAAMRCLTAGGRISGVRSPAFGQNRYADGSLGLLGSEAACSQRGPMRPEHTKRPDLADETVQNLGAITPRSQAAVQARSSQACRPHEANGRPFQRHPRPSRELGGPGASQQLSGGANAARTRMFRPAGAGPDQDRARRSQAAASTWVPE